MANRGRKVVLPTDGGKRVTRNTTSQNTHFNSHSASLSHNQDEHLSGDPRRTLLDKGKLPLLPATENLPISTEAVQILEMDPAQPVTAAHMISLQKQIVESQRQTQESYRMFKEFIAQQSKMLTPPPPPVRTGGEISSSARHHHQPDEGIQANIDIRPMREERNRANQGRRGTPRPQHSEGNESDPYEDISSGSNQETRHRHRPSPTRKRQFREKSPQDRLITFNEGDLNRRVQEMVSTQLAERSKEGSKRPMMSRHPFTKEVMAVRIPDHFRLPNLNMYDGRTDPSDHLGHFNAAMVLYGLSDGASCKAFPTSLKGVAATWYSDLKAESIGSFEELSNAFVARFQSSARCRKTASSLRNLKQKDGETIRAFLGRFNQATLEIRGLNDRDQKDALESAVTDSKLVESLLLNRPHNLEETLDRCNKYANLQESLSAREGTSEPKPKKPAHQRESRERAELVRPRSFERDRQNDRNRDRRPYAAYAAPQQGLQ